MSEIRNRIQGVLLGLAAGDRNGGPIRMAVRLAESLSERWRFDLEDILTGYLAWWRDGAFDTGPTTAAMLSLIDGGLDSAEAVERVHDQAGGMTAGCNPAHRCAPLAMARFLSDDELAGCALREARLTHRHPLAGDVAAAVAVLCRALIRRKPWDEALVLTRVGRLRQTIEALGGNNLPPSSTGGFAPEALQAACHFVAHHDSFADALSASLSFAGSANYRPVLVGAIAGAKWGATAITPKLLPDYGLMIRVWNAAEMLANEWEETG
jgi:ADP-ribosylglycohydrolase